MTAAAPAGEPLPALPPRDAWPTRIARLVRDALRLEDVGLIVWVAFQPVIARALGAGAGSPQASGGSDVFGGHDPLLGLVAGLALLGALACVATRADPGPTGASGVRGTIGPLAGGLMLVGAVAAQGLVGAPEPGFIVALGGLGLASLLPGLLPPIPVPYRRALVTPYVLVSASLFNGVIGQVGGLFDLHAALALGPAAAMAAVPPVLGVLVAFCGVYYVMLVYAPRQLAQPDGGAVAWLARFGVFVLAEVAAATLFSATA